MASQVSPGIVLKERDLSNTVIVGAQQITGAFASTFKKGPIGEIVNINSQKDLVDVFGRPADANAEDWYVASEFLGYGGRLAVVRAATSVLNATTGNSGVLVRNDLDWEAGTGSSETFVARTAGTWGNSIKVVVVDRGADQVITFDKAPDVTPVSGSTLTFASGKQAKVIAYSAGNKEVTVQLVDPTQLIFVGDSIAETEDPIASFTHNAATEPGRTPGSYPAPDTNGTAVFQVDVADASVGEVASGSAAGSADLARIDGVYTFTNPSSSGSGTGAVVEVSIASGVASATVTGGTGYVVGETFTISGTDPDDQSASFGGTTNVVVTVNTLNVVGGAVTVTLLTAGDGYSVGDTITLAGAATGGGSDIIVTVSTILDDETGVSAVRDWYTTTEIGSTGLKLSSIAPRPGTSDYADARELKYDEIHIAIIDTTGNISGAANTILERFTYLSKLEDGKNTEGSNIYYKTVINEQSTLIYSGSTLTASYVVGENWDQLSTDLSSGDAFALCGNYSNDLANGTDDYDYNSSEIGVAYDLFLDTEETTVDFVLMGGSMDLENDTKAKASKVISIASSRKDCVAFVSPHKGNQVGVSGALSTSQQKLNTINFFNGLTSTSYAVFDSGYKYFYDRFNDKYRYLACNGDVAGLCVATSATLDDWYSPAGLNRGSLRNAIRLAFNPNKADRDELYQSRINPIVSFPGSGVTLFGDKTALASPSAFDRINVRRLFLNVEKRVGELGKQVLFELNDVTTRSSFSSAVNSYLNEIQARRGVIDYLVVCDESNNTPEVIDRNEFVAELYIKPTRSINYVTITFTATKTGVSFSEVVGR